MILVNSAGGCATTMLIKYLTEFLPPRENPATFRLHTDDSVSQDQPLLASSLYAINYDAIRAGYDLSNMPLQQFSSEDDLMLHTGLLREAYAASYLCLKHACYPPAASVTAREGIKITSSPWNLGGGYGLVWDGERPPIGGPGHELFITKNENIRITKAIYLHGDPVDVVSTLFLKGNVEGDQIRDHMIKCSIYSYKQLTGKIFHAMAASMPRHDDSANTYAQGGIPLDSFSLWACKNQLDPFSFEASFDAWTASDNREYPTLVVKYETMWDNLPAIAEFLELDIDSFVAGFPQKRARKRPGAALDVNTHTNLSRLYSSLITKRSQVPNIFTIG